MKKVFILVVFSISVFFFSSCVTDYDFFDVSTDIKIDESLVLPVAEANVTLGDLLKKFGLPDNIDTTNSLISYADTFKFEFNYADLNRADTIKPFQKYLYLTQTPLFIPGNFPIDLPPFNADVEMAINGNVNKEHVDSIIINSAKMKTILEVSSDLQAISPNDVSVDFIFPEDTVVFENGYTPTFHPVAYGTPGYLPFGKSSILLKGSNKIPLKIKVNIKTQSTPIILSPTSYVLLKMNFEDVDLSRVYGLFDINLENENTFDTGINFDDYVPNGLIQIANPKLDLSVSSNVGMNLNLNINYLKAYNSSTPGNIFEAVFDNPKTGTRSNSYSDVFEGPLLYGNWVTKNYSQFNNVNGEFDKLFDTKPYPNVIDYKVSMSTNPTRTSNFISTDNKTTAILKLNVPFQFKKDSYFTLTDTINDLNIGDALNQVDSAILVLKLKNGFPLKAKYRMTYWKSEAANDTITAFGGSVNTVGDGSQLGNLTSEYIINSAKVDANGYVSEVAPQLIKIMLNKAQIEALKSTKFIIFSLYLSGDQKDVDGAPTTFPISFTTRNRFGVKLGLFVKGGTVLNLFNN